MNHKPPTANRQPLTANHGFSLVELIIAISLMGLIILAIVAVDVGSRGFLKTSDDESTLQNEANFIMEFIVRDLGKSFKGTKNNPSVKVTPSNTAGDTLEIRNRGSGLSFELNNSKWVRYQFDSAAKTIKKQTCEGYPANIDSTGKCAGSWSGPRQLINNIVSACVFNFDADTAVVGITITARAKPSENPGQNNPEVILENSVSSRSISR